MEQTKTLKCRSVSERLDASDHYLGSDMLTNHNIHNYFECIKPSGLFLDNKATRVGTAKQINSNSHLKPRNQNTKLNQNMNMNDIYSGQATSWHNTSAL